MRWTSTTDQSRLLNFVVQQSTSSRVRWLVSSRNWPNIEEQLERAHHKVRLSLELNAVSVKTAVTSFILAKVAQLAQEKSYSRHIQEAVREHLIFNADDTFLWAALVCQSLETTSEWNVLKKISSFPPGLNALYHRMMHHLREPDDAELCKSILATTVLVHRPLALVELISLVKELEDLNENSVLKIVGLCGSFLTLRAGTVYFVHQSAKDLLLAEVAEEVFPFGKDHVHHTILAQSLKVMSRDLGRDIYGLNELGLPIEEVKVPNPDPLSASRYSCVCWIDHACISKLVFSARDSIDAFLRKKYLYWLEALSLEQSIPKGIFSMTNLHSLFQVCTIQIILSQPN